MSSRTHGTALVETTPGEPRMYPVEVAGRMLGLKRSTTWEEIRLHRLKSVRVGRRRLVPAEFIDEYVELLKTEAKSDLAA